MEFPYGLLNNVIFGQICSFLVSYRFNFDINFLCKIFESKNVFLFYFVNFLKNSLFAFNFLMDIPQSKNFSFQKYSSIKFAVFEEIFFFHSQFVFI